MAHPIAAGWRALVERAVAECKAGLGADLVALALFGSVARDEAGPASDLDLYVVVHTRPASLFDPRFAWTLRLRETPEYQVLAAQGYRPEPMPVIHTVEELRAHPWILLDIADHGVILHDPKGVLAEELDAVRDRLSELGARRVTLPDGHWYWDLKPDWRPGDVIEL
jgi:predicted nucleotidyltransferase